MSKLIQELKRKLTKQIQNCQHSQEIGAHCFCRQISCSYPNCQACSLTLKTIDQHFQKKHPETSEASKIACPHGCFRGVLSKKFFVDCSIHNPSHSINLKIQDQENMKKTKKQIIVVPTTQNIEKTKPTKTAIKPRSVRSKSNTLAYYNCLIDQVANPTNEKVKITSLAHHCKCNKGKVAAARQEHKQQLVKEVAKNYKAFGESLGHYLHADIVGCVKELKKK
jgi:hypothetical protein